MYFVPLYFQVTAGVSNTIAGLHLVPAVTGNAVGGVAAGIIIRRQVANNTSVSFLINYIHRTGRYKAVILGSSILASVGYILLVIRWCGDTNWWESMYIAPG
jgi:hypothetical protein